jgi:hypothetical protein
LTTLKDALTAFGSSNFSSQLGTAFLAREYRLAGSAFVLSDLQAGTGYLLDE